MSQPSVRIVMLILTWLDVIFLSTPYFFKAADQVRSAQATLADGIVDDLNEWADVHIAVLPSGEVFSYPVNSETADFIDASVSAVQQMGADVEWNPELRLFELVPLPRPNQSLRLVRHSLDEAVELEEQRYD
ncbi:MAG: hypothetical protein AAF456_14510 [Planctomycetota bacterium]